LDQLPTSLSDVTAESEGLCRLMSGIKQLYLSGYLTSVDTRCLAQKLLQFVFQVGMFHSMFFLTHTLNKNKAVVDRGLDVGADMKTAVL